jgi:biopolymer transport protein ExbB
MRALFVILLALAAYAGTSVVAVAQEQPAGVVQPAPGGDEAIAPSSAGAPAATDAPVVPGETGTMPIAMEEGASTLPRDLSPWGMFMGADIVVKAVMVGLAFASLATWTVWLAKSLELAAARRRACVARSAMSRIRETLDEAPNRALGTSRHRRCALVRAAAKEEVSAVHRASSNA